MYIYLNFIFLISFYIFISFKCIANELPKTVSYIVTDGNCCGGEESDPHAVHGIQANDGSYILSGKSLDKSGKENGFIIKIPGNLTIEKYFLNPDEEYNLEWSFILGSNNKKDGINASAVLSNSVFIAGYLENSKGVIDRYLGKLDIFNGELIWEIILPSKNKKLESAFESILITEDKGIILTGVVNADKGSIEGFKSYGNPQDGNAFGMFFSSDDIKTNNKPINPLWEVHYKNSLSGKSIKELQNKKGFVIATSTIEEPRISKVIKINTKGNIIWEKTYPVHGEITDISVTNDSYYISGHKKDNLGGIDGSISKISNDGSLIWNKSYGNPKGGDNKFKNSGKGNRKLIFDECWSITSTDDGAIMACGTGIEGCEEFEGSLLKECLKDPRKTWRSYLIKINNDGDLIWEKTGSFTFPGEENEEDVPSTASEWIFQTQNGNFASVVDLGFGVGLEILTDN